MPSTAVRAAATSGVATAELEDMGRRVQITTDPSSASGTGTLTVKSIMSSGFQPVFKDGAAITDIDLSAVSTILLDGSYDAIKVTSSNSSDAFDLIVSN